MLFGKILAYAGMTEGKYVTYLPSYGAEVRGGTAHCNVIISSEEIASPVIGSPDTAVVMNHPSLLKFEPRVKKAGLLIVNSSLILHSPKREDIEIISLPATEIADEVGNIQVANMVVLGCYLTKKNVIKIDTIIDSLKKVLPKHRHSLLEINKKAILTGAEFLVKQHK